MNLLIGVSDKSINYLATTLERLSAANFETFENLRVHVLLITENGIDEHSIYHSFHKDFTDKLSLETAVINSGKCGEGYLIKLLFSYALKNRFDYVINLMYDLNIDPEELIELFKKSSEENESLVIIGKTNDKKHFNIKNIYLTLFSLPLNLIFNWTLGSDYKDFLSCKPIGIPIEQLKKIPFTLNQNDTLMNSELGLQLALTKPSFLVIREKESAHYKNPLVKELIFTLLETCKINLSQKGIYYKTKYDVFVDNTYYPLKLSYLSSHTLALNVVSPGSSVIDIGSGPVPVSYQLIKKGCSISTVDIYPLQKKEEEANHIICDLNDDFELPIRDYDYLLLLDILEHLNDPERFLDKLSSQFTTKPQKIVLTTGNIAFLPLRLSLFLGIFNYGKRGILDKTHIRLFTFRTFKHLVRESGMEIEKIRGIPIPFPLVFGDNKFSRFLLFLNQLLIKLSRSIFSYQIFILAKSFPSIDHQLASVKKSN